MKGAVTMAVTSIEAQRRTEAFARVIGPYVVVFTGVLAIRLPDLMSLTDSLFANPIMSWMLGAMMILGGLLIIALHRHWRGPAAIVISLFGWFVGLRGLALIATTSALESAVNTTALTPALLTAARIFFGLLALTGLWLTYVGWFQKKSQKMVQQATQQPAAQTA
jgi:hypothetical protein